jgi:hypothetical protein
MSGRNLVASLGFIAAIAASPQAAIAQQDAGLYLGAPVGRSDAKDACKPPTVTGFVVTACDDKDTSWKVFGGYQFKRNFALEAGYIDFGKMTPSGTVLGIPVSLRAEADAFELLAVGTLSLTDRFSLYRKAGLFRWDVDARGTAAGITVTAEEKGTEATSPAAWSFSDTTTSAIPTRQVGHQRLEPRPSVQVLTTRQSPARSGDHTARPGDGLASPCALPRSLTRGATLFPAARSRRPAFGATN